MDSSRAALLRHPFSAFTTRDKIPSKNKRRIWLVGRADGAGVVLVPVPCSMGYLPSSSNPCPEKALPKQRRGGQGATEGIPLLGEEGSRVQVMHAKPARRCFCTQSGHRALECSLEPEEESCPDTVEEPEK